MMLFLENTLIFPAPKFPQGNWQPAGLNHEDVFFESADKTKLHGWFVEHPNARAVVLFCHGNGESVAGLDQLMRDYVETFEVSIFAFDYRGYGRSEGSPNEAGILADGDAAQKWLAKRAGVELAEIVLVGRSLGGAVAVDLAARNGARGLVLERTFTSMPDVASRLYRFLPVRMLMKTQLDSINKIDQYTGPLLQSHGTADSLIPLELGRRLFDAAGSQDKKFIEEDGGEHNDGYELEYWQALQSFLKYLPQRKGTEQALTTSL